MVHPRFASTVVLVRPNENGGFEVLLTRRPEEMRFLAAISGPTTLAAIATTTGLDTEQAIALAEELIERGLIEVHTN